MVLVDPWPRDHTRGRNLFLKGLIAVVNIQTPYEIFIYVEGRISDPNLKAG